MAPLLVEQGCIQILAHTANSVVYAVDTEATPGNAKDTPTVLKGWAVWYKGEEPLGPVRSPEEADEMVRSEAAIYEILGKHDRILDCLGLEIAVLKDAGPDPMAWALRLERAPVGGLRKYLYDHPTSPPDERTRLGLARQFAEGLAYMHSRGVVWNDISARNALLFDGWRLKLCDFGTALPYNKDQNDDDDDDDEEEEDDGWWGAEARYVAPGPEAHNPSRRDIQVGLIHRELFALGSAIYEIVEWKVPYGSEDEVPVEKVHDMLNAGEWPELSSGNPAADIIRRCWAYEYQSAEEVVQDLKTLLETKFS